MIYGYCRVSSKDQSLQRQIDSLIEYGVEEKDIFIDKISGKSMDRLGYNRLKEVLKNGDTVVFHELDRFSRNFEEGKSEIDFFQKNNIKLVFLDMDFLNAMFENNDLMVNLMGYVQLLTALAIAEKERQRNKKRQREGIEIGKKNGVHLGRKREISDDHIEEMKEKYRLKNQTVNELCKFYGISRTSFYRYINPSDR